MTVPAKFAVTITYESLMGHPSRKEEFIQEVNKYNPEELIHIACLFNHFLDTWHGGVDEENVNVLINAYCPPAIVQKINALPRYDGNPRYLFHRLQLLFLIK